MEFLINPNVSYVLLVLGLMTAAIALLAPGTGLLEAAALITIALAGYGIINLPVNGWALLVIIAGAVPVALALLLRMPRKRKIWLLLVSVLIFLIGSALLFGGQGWVPAVNPILMLILWPLALGLTWLIAEKAMEASASRPVFDLDRLVGMIGKASTDIRGQGTAYVNGEEWTAISDTYIPAGSKIKVLRRNGLTIEVDIVKA
jgi:membrane-bound serine protease (ClpP class)